MIYYRLIGWLDDQIGKMSESERVVLFSKIIEYMYQCTDDFHIRLDVIIASWQRPALLHQLLYSVRTALVEKVRATLAREVHADNRITLVVNIDGLGTELIRKEDSYVGNLRDREIRRALK